MVQTSGFDKKMSAMRGLVRERMTSAIERNATKVVQEMQLMLAMQYPAVAAQVEIRWTWGDAPRGSVTIATVRGRTRESLTVTIYARAKSGSGISAGWFEFGTAPRVQQTTGRSTGRIIARPFFFPVYRANKSRVLSNLRSTLRRTIRQINAM